MLAYQVQLLKETKAFAFDVMNTLLAGVEFDKAQLEELDDLWVVRYCSFYDPPWVSIALSLMACGNLQDFTNGGLDMLGLDLPFTDLGKGMAASARIKTIIADALVKAYGPDTNTREYDGHNIVTGLLRMKVSPGFLLLLDAWAMLFRSRHRRLERPAFRYRRRRQTTAQTSSATRTLPR